MSGPGVARGARDLGGKGWIAHQRCRVLVAFERLLAIPEMVPTPA